MDWLKDWILWTWEMVAWICFSLGDKIMGTLFDITPLGTWLDENGMDNSFGGFRSIVDAWIPLTEAIGLLAAVMAFQLTLIVIKWTLKFVPGLGG